MNELYRATGADPLLDTARSLVPIVAERAVAANIARAVPAETVAVLQGSGVFRALQPKRHGGLEIDPNTYLDFVSTISEGCMSSGWICAVQGSVPFLLAQFSEQVKDEIWRNDPSTLIAGQLLPSKQVTRVDGGYRITGRWPYVSGSTHSDWYIFGGIAPEDGPTPAEYFIFMVPRSDAEIIDVWDVAGLKASSSNDVAVTDLFVPAHRTLNYADAMSGAGIGTRPDKGSIFHVPFAQIFAFGLSCTVVGALRGMLEAFIAHGRSRVAVNGARSSEDPVAQLLCAETASTIDELEVTRRRAFDEMLAASRAGEMSSLDRRRLFKFQASHSAERCTLLASRIFKASGSSAIFNKLPFARMLADMQAAKQHIAFQYESAGRNWGAHMLGGPVRPDMMI